MNKPKTGFQIRAVMFKEGEWFSAQCLDFDIATQAHSLTDLRYELERVLVGHLAVARELGRAPFQGLNRAPQRFWDMFEKAELTITTDDRPDSFGDTGVVIEKLKYADPALSHARA